MIIYNKRIICRAHNSSVQWHCFVNNVPISKEQRNSNSRNTLYHMTNPFNYRYLYIHTGECYIFISNVCNY